ncbi:putative serine/threonine-protein kinase PBL5 [Apium graveolens]|uniref:putative serine/threonine-protein kinase PBL5 n=1 Tax=Apium graveolens TaxID=4045 RepID=UPI003D794F4F
MRPNNVLLTHDYDPLLANFGLARNQYEDLNQSSETRVLKTFEYLAPEYEDSGIDSSKTDVYSLGVVLLELITGRKTIEETKGKSFLRWARPLLKDKTYGELMDPVVLESHDLHQLFWMVRLTEKCISPDPSKRFSIHKVVNTLLYISPDHDNVDLSLPESEIEPKNRMRETL